VPIEIVEQARGREAFAKGPGIGEPGWTMIRRRGGVEQRRGAQGPGLAIGLGLLVLLGVDGAQAGPIWRHGPHPGLTVQARAVDRWEPYYQVALRNHWMNVQVPRVVLRSLQPGADGLLPQSSLVEYLQWRHGLSPIRFDRYHPFLGPMLERDQLRRFLTTPPSLAIVPPTRQTGIDALLIPPSTQSPQLLIPPPQVPEPSMLGIGLALAVVVARAQSGRKAPGPR
jgi:hypothetical protein